MLSCTPALFKMVAQQFWVGGSHLIFKLDNHPKMTSQMDFKWSNSDNINMLKWSVQSPDLNPIGHL